MTVDDVDVDVEDETPDRDAERKGPVDKAPRRTGARRQKPGPRERARTKRDQRRDSIAAAIAELAELGDAVRGRTVDVDDLAEVARRDGDLMADVLAELAESFDPLAFVVDKVLGMPVKSIRAFGPLVRALFARSRELRRRRDELAEDFARRLLAGAQAHGLGEPRDGDRFPLDGSVFEYKAAFNAWQEVPQAQLESEARALQELPPV